ncbi:hypothetical protein GCM10011391_23860 [Pullulanibacillus camelliae]|uniref:PucR C-terminal helix-turn-helix domain-containing protein n=1 Tax=Pullulanibacillus camelliae TaxID=1707096 RepID=A0A8J2YI22_9BACL|nr:helix-turn-helix domain-containing protein [Pullulanibacillus camelliae]GGE44288.1 hypothetical protein GCM10011391_23860 [Pullulanibacillus camelliae]
MLEALKAIYGQAFTYYNDQEHLESYYWFQDQAHIQFGIKKSAVTEKELQLLKLYYETVDQFTTPKSPAQKAWANLLFNGTEASNPKDSPGLSFPAYPIYIHFKSLPNDLAAFEEAMSALVSETPVLLWRENEAILILSEPSKRVVAEEIVDLMATEFFVDVAVMIGAIFYTAQLSKSSYEWHHQLFERFLRIYPRKRVTSLDHLIPIFLLENLSPEAADFMFKKIQNALSEGGTELKETLLTFFEHNMNVSTASKALYIHRNSLQYRLDKFHEKTDLDPKTFIDAAIIYIGILKYSLG